ncbi:hypothetical protein I4U23_022521 [Adineta vaga]|nr:hypothetical protein I4U23_022521 [Adineta vaga]
MIKQGCEKSYRLIKLKSKMGSCAAKMRSCCGQDSSSGTKRNDHPHGGPPGQRRGSGGSEGSHGKGHGHGHGHGKHKK